MIPMMLFLAVASALSLAFFLALWFCDGRMR